MSEKLLNRAFVSKGKTIITEGDAANKAFFIESGQVEVFRKNAKGEEQRLSLVGAGEIVGEFAFFEEAQKRTANVRAASDCVIIALTLKDVQRYMDGMDKPARALFKILLNRLKRANDQLVNKYDSAVHLNEACRIACDNLYKNAADTESRENFENNIRPVLNTLLEAVNNYEKMEQAKKGL
jgi:CRP-like cAMP-binding protein